VLFNRRPLVGLFATVSLLAALPSCSSKTEMATIQGQFRVVGGGSSGLGQTPSPFFLVGDIEVHLGALVVPRVEGPPGFGNVVGSTSTDAHGRFKLRVASPGTYTLTGTSAHWALCWSETVTVTGTKAATADVNCNVQ
jgi:hypothetical protein